MLIRTPWKRVFLFVYVDDIKFAGKKQSLDPMWKLRNKEVDCTQRQIEISKDVVDNYKTMFES